MTTNDTLRVTDSRTGRSYELPIVDGAIRAIDLRQIKTSDDDFGLLSYDPAFQNTASCRSAITFIDGDKGILRYRGYPIEELASRSSFLDVAWLLLRGELPDKEESAGWAHQISHHTYVHENVKKFIDGFHHDAHPMGILVSTLAALSTFYPEASAVADRATQDEQVVRLIAKMPTLAAFAYRHARGLPYAYPDDDLSYAGNFLNMMAKMTEPKYDPNPVLERALDVLFILHADHEQNCSTNAMRGVASSQVDPYSAAAAAAAALYGPLHGGANEQVLKMLREIGSVDNVPAYISRVKQRRAAPDGVRSPGVQELRPAGHDHQGRRRRGVRGDRPQPAARHRAGARADRARGRLLHQPQALPERRLLLGHHLPGDGLPGGDVPGAVRDRPDARLAGSVAGRLQGPGAEDRPAAADLRRRDLAPPGRGGRLTAYRASWLDCARPRFGVANLPYGVFSAGEGPRVGVRIGDSVLDLARALDDEVFGEPSLNAFMAQGRARWSEVRARITELLTDERHRSAVEAALRPLSAVRLHLPFAPGDYVDFFGNEYHAANAGRLFRPGGEPLTPNWKHLPIGYHGRSGTIVPSGTPVPRPRGQRPGKSGPTFGPSRRLDFEAEVGFVVGVGSAGPVRVSEFAEHVFGVFLLNDWSSRDLQAWESRPLGPFLAKSFATSISPWVVPLDALEHARVSPPPRDPEPLPYLADTDKWGLDLTLEVRLNGQLVSRPPFAATYWTAAQMLAHMTSNGASTRTGDLFASGTVSGPDRDQCGCLLELSWGGAEPLALADGSVRSYLEDGDEVTISATAPAADGGRIGFGEVTGQILPSPPLD